MSTHGGGGQRERQRTAVRSVREMPRRSVAPSIAGNGNVTVAERASEAGRRARGNLESFFGRPLTDEEIGALVGAQPGAYVSIASGHGQYADDTVVFHMTGRDDAYDAERYLTREPDGTLVMHNQTFEVRDTGRGIGTDVFADQVRALSTAGVARIETGALRAYDQYADKSYNGYYTWPRLGYDGPIPAHLRAQLPDDLSTAQNLSDLMRTNEGREWWRENGDSVDVSFDLRPGSRSMQALDAYLRHRSSGWRGL